MKRLSQINEDIFNGIQRRDGKDELRKENEVVIEYRPENMTELKKIIFNKVLKDKNFDGYLDMRDTDVSNFNSLENAFSFISYTDRIKGINVKGWNVSNVVNMTNCFQGCIELVSIKGLDTWDVSNVLVMRDMFFKCVKLRRLDIENWNIKNVQDMGDMFGYCESLKKLDLEKWNPNDKVITDHMFKECPIGYEIVDGHFERYRLPQA